MKTFQELLASGTQTELVAAIAAHTKRIDELFAESDKRVTKSNSKEELDEIIRLEGEVKQLGERAAEIKRVEDIRASNAKRKADMNTPVHPVGHQGDAPSVPSHPSGVEFRGVSSLKNITGATRQDAETKAYRFGQFLLAGVFKMAKAAEWCRDNGIEIKAQNEGVNDQGGVLVPPEFDRMLIDLREQFGVFRRFTKVTPMSSETKTVPRRTGGVTAYWVGENQTITDSTKTWDNVNLVAKKLAALVIYSSEIDEDAIINLGDDLAGEIAYAFANKEDEAGFNGDATSTYGGITGVREKIKGLSATIADIAGLVVGAGNAYSELVLVDFNKVVGRLPQYADSSRAAWYVHKTFFHEVMEKLALAAGGVTAREIQDGAAGPRPKFLGYPVNFAQVLPKVEANSQVCALLGDLSMASTMGDRRRTTLFTNPYRLSNLDQIEIKGTERVDINVHDVGNASSTAALRQPGPIVGLITAAS